VCAQRTDLRAERRSPRPILSRASLWQRNESGAILIRKTRPNRRIVVALKRSKCGSPELCHSVWRTWEWLLTGCVTSVSLRRLRPAHFHVFLVQNLKPPVAFL